MIFATRKEAGRVLAQHLQAYRGQSDVVVLGLARGGVPVAFEVAQAIDAPLDVLIVRKLGVPGREELAFGAVASGGIHIIDPETIDIFGLSPTQIRQALTQGQQEIERYERLYRSDRPPRKLMGMTVILVDDGIATGSSMIAAVAALRKMEVNRIVVAVPVGPPATSLRLRNEVEDVICAHTAESFYAVGAFYEDFSQVTDEEVGDLLRRASLRMKCSP